MIYYFLGTVLVALGAAFYAGYDRNYFYSEATEYDVVVKKHKRGEMLFDYDKVVSFVGVAFFSCLLWPIVLPMGGVYMLGRKLSGR